MKLPKVTKKDRLQYPHHTDLSVAGIKMIASLTDRQVMDVLENESGSKTFKSIFLAMGPSTNPNWIISQIAATAYGRGLIDERTLDRIMGD